MWTIRPSATSPRSPKCTQPQGLNGSIFAKRALGSAAARRGLNVYDLSTVRVGKFDVAFVGAILLHLRDPVLALSKVAEVADEVFLADVVWLSGSLLFPRRPVAWLTGVDTFSR